ncbi:MAG: hypothetical protein ACREJU_16500 [Nitrospiraceae bacterium]
MSPTSSRHVRVWGGIAVVFLCGLIVGNVATTAYHDYQRQQKWEQGLAGLKQRVMTHLIRELRLSVEQQRLIEPIVARAEGDLLRLRMAQQPHVQGTMDRTIEALQPTLNPEQQGKLDELYRTLKRRWDSDGEYVRHLQTGVGE